jgi:hypothetical protein
MGSVHFGAPEGEMRYLADAMGLRVFFEGGTYKGGTALLASGMFGKVFTVERSESMFAVAKTTIGSVANITMLKGDTRNHLQPVLEQQDDILFWLDAHWSGGETYGQGDECPLITELEIIFRFRKNYAILIDDARLFLAPPPKPHVLGDWPTIKAIVRAIPEDWDMLVYDDVMYLLPGTASLSFREFVQSTLTVSGQSMTKRLPNARKVLKSLLHKE